MLFPQAPNYLQEIFLNFGSGNMLHNIIGAKFQNKNTSIADLGGQMQTIQAALRCIAAETIVQYLEVITLTVQMFLQLRGVALFPAIEPETSRQAVSIGNYFRLIRDRRRCPRRGDSWRRFGAFCWAASESGECDND